MDFEKIEQKLKAASSKETCWPGCADTWSVDNPAWGHCVMYALFINKLFGGEVVFVEAVTPDGVTIPHYFNRIRGQNLDFSASQFAKMTAFVNEKVLSKKELLTISGNVAKRYEIFRDRVIQAP